MAGGMRGADRFDRLESWADRHPVRVGGHNALLVAIRGTRRFVQVRVTGLAAEMTYFAMISVLPLVTALGATLGYLERLIGPRRVLALEEAVVDGLAAVFDQELTTDVLAPLVEGLLRQERTGVAIGSIAVALWLASRMFRAAIRALDDAYLVPERRSLVAQVGLGLGFSLSAVVTLATLLSMVVIGPLLGGGRRIAEWLGVGQTMEALWAVARWPAVGLLCVAFLVVLYRFGPNVQNTWRQCLPGAAFSAFGLVLVAIGFQVYLRFAGPGAPEIGQAGEAVAAAAQMIGAALAAVLWLWLSSIVILSGGVLNAELQRTRDETTDLSPPRA